MVAHTALKTPTAVAGWLVERMAGIEGWLDSAALQLHDTTAAAMHASEVRLERLSGELRRLSGELLTRQSLRLEHLAGVLSRSGAGFPRAADDAAGKRRGADRRAVARTHPPAGIRRGAERRQGGDLGPAVAAGEPIEVEVADGKISATVNAEKIWQKKS